MHKSEPVQENDTEKIFWNFEMQIDHQIPARKPDSDN